MLALVVAHLLPAVLLPLVSARSRPAGFAVAALPPVVALVWALTQAGPALAGGPDGGPGIGVVQTTAWAPALGLTLSFRLDALALVMVVLVSGLGAVVLWYCVGYFDPDSPQATRSAALLLAFAGAMLGLVLADDLLTLYVFWELTSVASFLLVGQSGRSPAERRAAVQALLVTVFGGLAMLLGFVLLGYAAGTYRISEILADPPDGGLVAIALPLILLGAFTKSAQLPFHPWLPAAMVAPTPVSAYLHAASMVKAGVYLVARLAPGFGDRVEWWAPVLVIGLGTMLVGGWRALGQTDLKRLLAFGTVSQLGLLVVLLGAGQRIAALAGVAMLLAHGLFKAPLFLVVGTIDKATGTRDVRELSGLRRALPGCAAAAALAAASMAGLPPMLGFAAKEAAFEAFLLGAEGPGGLRDAAVLVVLLVGTTLTVAYSARFLVGAFGRRDDIEPTPVRRRPGFALTAPIWLCALVGAALGAGAALVDAPAAAYAGGYPEVAGAGDYHVALWHGFGWPLLLSALAVAAGLLLHRSGAGRRSGPGRVDAQRGYQHVVDGVGRAAVVVTGRLQVGSLPVYLGAILLTFVLLPGLAALLAGSVPADLPLYDAAVQLPLAAALVVAALALTRARRRFTAVLLVGVIGYGVGGLFVVDGAPDLALAQILVETLSLVAFVFVLRALPAHFTERRVSRIARLPRVLIAAVGGLVVAGTAVLLSAARTGPPSAAADYLALAPTGAGATNVVSAIVVDFRALDTVGEIGVLFIAAAGVASLVLATRYDPRRARRADPEDRTGPSGGDGPTGQDEAATDVGEAFESWDTPRGPWSLPGGFRGERRRTLLLEVTTRAVFPTVLVFSLYLLLVGHYGPGGGFSAGLVAGLAFVLRYLAGGDGDIGTAFPVRPPVLAGVGLVIAVAAALVPLAFGGPVLATVKLAATVPVLGALEVQTSLFLDVGVYLLIIGVVLDLLRSLGAGIERDQAAAAEPAGEQAAERAGEQAS